jgi:hypothetical protein
MRSSAVFWRLYIELEMRVQDLAKAKALLMIALSRCPLNKGRNHLIIHPASITDALY